MSQRLYLVEQLLLFSALVLQFLLHFPYLGILSTGGNWSLVSLHVGLAMDVVISLAEPAHPIAIVISHLFNASQSSFVLVTRMSQVIGHLDWFIRLKRRLLERGSHLLLWLSQAIRVTG